ncbi:hypothetical protein WJX74_011088 [Apatococcus lobatus]|uniref:serine--tRNA ligase n=2 Tax=Apatococcus TaxID=904362 RepID=A0AAW1TJD1_9CHLO
MTSQLQGRCCSVRLSGLQERVQLPHSRVSLPHTVRRPRTFRSLCIRAESNRGGGGGFAAGFLIGGTIFGALGYIFAPQISAALLSEDQRLRLPRFLDDKDDKDPEATKQDLSDKIAQLNAAIDDVSAQLKAQDQVAARSATGWSLGHLTAPFRSYALRPAAAAAAATATEPSLAEQTAPTPSFRAAIDFGFVRDNLELVTQNCIDRNSQANPKLIAELYGEYLQLNKEVNSIRQERNENAANMKRKLEAEERQRLIDAGKGLKEALGAAEIRLSQVQDLLQLEGQKLPNLTHPESPVGSEEEAVELQSIGQQPAFPFQPRDHLQLGQHLDLFDFDSAAEVAGSKFYYLRNAAALLELALISWGMQRVAARGYTPMSTPDLVRASLLEKCGFQPRATNTQVYSVENSPLCLTGTAEVPLAGIHADKILAEEQLPIRMAAFGHCFRTEAGSGGSASKGLYRVHQFSKVEMFVVSTPEQSEELLQELVSIEQEMYSELGLHFKVLDMPSQDLGAPAYRKIDFEAWMPGMDRYGEISSASNCTDYQSRRLSIRYRPNPGPDASNGAEPPTKKSKTGGTTAFCHTLNATAAAVPRLIVAILENNQQEDGSVIVPEVLRPFMAGIDVLRPPGASLL